jgi:hypothetical protein
MTQCNALIGRMRAAAVARSVERLFDGWIEGGGPQGVVNALDLRLHVML